MLSDKLFFWLFQNSPDRILSLVDGLPPDAGGYSFSAPVLKQREYRLDGLFLPPPGRPDLPALILEAQMAPDTGFLRRLYAETARLLQQQPTIATWRVVVITPSRHLVFGDPEPVAEFLERRVHWVELQPKRWSPTPAQPDVPLFQRLLTLLVRPETQIPAAVHALRRQVASLPDPGEGADLITLIPIILLTRFRDRPVEEIAAMAGITADDFSQSLAYQQIFGLGEAKGEAKVALRLLHRLCGPLSSDTTAQINALPVEKLEALADALLDFQGPADLTAWLAANS